MSFRCNIKILNKYNYWYLLGQLLLKKKRVQMYYDNIKNWNSIAM